MKADDIRDEPVDPLAELKTAAWLGGQTFDELVVIVDHLIVEGFTLLVGAPKAGKSWLVLAAALGVACGGRVLGLTVKPMPVLYLALEDGDRRLQARMQHLMGDEPLPDGLHYLTRLPPDTAVHDVTRAWLDRNQPGLVFVDTLGRARPPQQPGEGVYQADYRVGVELKALVDEHPGSALVVVHHDRKAEANDFVESISGSNGLAGSADGLLVIRRERGGTDAILSVTGRDITEAQYAATFDNGHWSFQGGDIDTARDMAVAVNAALGKGDVARSVISYIRDNGSGTAKQIVEALHVSDDVARQTLVRLASTHRLDRIGRGIYVLPP